MTRHYRTLDAMRGVAAIAVVCMHAHSFLTPLDFPQGFLAVDLFFMLSGLVISHAYGPRLSKGMGVARFALLRIVRVYPLYLLGTLIGILFFVTTTRFGARVGISAPEVAAAIGFAIVMLPVPLSIESHGWLSPFNIAGWSLVFELAANVAFAMIWRRLTTPVLIVVILTSGALFVWGAIDHGTVDVGAEWSTAIAGVPRAFFSFFVGVALDRFRRSFEKTTALAWLCPALLALTFLPGAQWGLGYQFVCILLIYPPLIYVATLVEPRGAAIAATLGAISFAIYAIHSPALPIANSGLRFLGITPSALTPWSGLLIVAALCVAAWLCDRVYDNPVRRWLSRRLALRRSAAA